MPAIVQFKTFVNVNSPGALPAPPTAGNLLLCIFSHWNNTPSMGSGWTQIYNDNGVTLDGTCACRKYAGFGESATQAPATTGNESTGIILEISGVTGVAATDIIGNHFAHDLTTTPSFTTTSFNTGANDTMVIGMFWGGAGTGVTEVAPSVTAGQTDIATQVDNVGAGHRHSSAIFSNKLFAVSGSAVQFTATWAVNQTKGAYSIISLNWPAPSVAPGRITQGVVLALAPTPPPPVRITQGPVLVLGVTVPGGIITQVPVLVLGQHTPCLTRWCQCWKIVRTDGLTFAFTDHDEVVEFHGTPHSPCHSLSSSASELGAFIGSVGNLSLSGLISDESITETDLLAGKFDGAEVEIWMVPWYDTGGEIPFRLSAGVAGDVTQGINNFTMEALTPGARLQQQALLQDYTPSCRFELGDARCTFNLESLRVNGTVTSVAQPSAYNLASRRMFSDSSRAEPDRYFELGVLEWLTGPNAGLSSEVKDFGAASFVLWQPSVYQVSVGDTYTLVPGCDKSFPTCVSKFSNGINFGGFKDVPGGDSQIASPDAKLSSNQSGP